MACSCRTLPIMDLQTSVSLPPVRSNCCCSLSHLWLYIDCLVMWVVAFQEFVFHQYIHWLPLSLNFHVFLCVQKLHLSFSNNFIIFKSYLFIPVNSKTVLFEILSVHHILYNLLKTHISIASSLLSKSLFKVHVSQPYNKTEYTNVFTMFIFVDFDIFEFVNTGFNFPNVDFAFAIVFLLL